MPHDAGRVAPGTYVAGWIKRGPTGFIGTNKTCAQETVSSLLDDLDAGTAPVPIGDAAAVEALVAQRQPHAVDLTGWQAVDSEERLRGRRVGRPRSKVVDVDELRRVAGEAAPPAARRRRYPAVHAR